MAVRIVEVTITPTPLRPGVPAHAVCRVEGDEPVQRVYAVLPDGQPLNLVKVSETEFEIRQEVPWGAPPGTYPITLVAEGASGARTTYATSVTIQ
ncbi:MAG: hypothetical protein NZ959_06655 [Armatimonadetes bacterium]|nr:hypothetical protein [Armatimonadota bacterium]MDW8121153.1 hypothetical protein [Armatimonadota bacterium]